MYSLSEERVQKLKKIGKVRWVNYIFPQILFIILSVLISLETDKALIR